MKKILYKVFSIVITLTLITTMIACDKDKNNKDFSVSEIDKPMYTDDTEIASTKVNGAKLYTDSLSNEKFLACINAKDEGVKADGNDCYSSLQNALNKVKNLGGGTLFLPKGIYTLDRSLNIPENVCLRGEWATPTSETIEEGTIIEITCDATVDNVSTDKAAIRMSEGATISHLTFYYPDQTETGSVAFPYTVANNGYYSMTVEDCTFVNSYRAIEFKSHNSGTINNVYITCLDTGVDIDRILDITGVYNVHISPKYFKMYDSTVNETQLKAHMKANVTAYSYARYDWIFSDGCTAECVNKGIKFYKTENGTTNGQFSNIEITDSKTPISVETFNNIGLQFSLCKFEATGTDAVTLDLTKDDTMTDICFNTCDFSSDDVVVLGNHSGAVCFNNCIINGKSNNYSIKANRGSYIFDTCNFKGTNDIYIGKGDELTSGVSNIKVVGCTFDGQKEIQNNITDKSQKNNVTIDDTNNSNITKLTSNNSLSEGAKRQPTKDNVIYASDYGALSTADLEGKGTDSTKAIQQALNVCAKKGGGYVVLDGGKYLLTGYLYIPENTLLIGANAYLKHFAVGTKGTVLVCDYGENSSTPFINVSKNAGVEGFSVFYPKQKSNEGVADKVYSTTISLSGDNSYLQNVSVIDAYRMINVSGDNCLVSGTRGLGLEKCFVAENAKNLQVQFTLFTIGDWQDGAGVDNAPPGNWWQRFPNFENYGLYFNNCDGVKLYECFTFGMGQGVTFSNCKNVLSFGTGVDCARDSLTIDGSGENLIFINSELVGVGSSIHSKSTFTGEANFYNTYVWAGVKVNAILEGGKVNIQQYKSLIGGVEVKGGEANIQNCLLDNNQFDHIVTSGNAKGKIINSFGQYSFNTGDMVEDFEVIYCTKR